MEVFSVGKPSKRHPEEQRSAETSWCPSFRGKGDSLSFVIPEATEERMQLIGGRQKDSSHRETSTAAKDENEKKKKNEKKPTEEYSVYFVDAIEAYSWANPKLLQ